MSFRWEEVAAFSQVVVKALRVVSELKLSDAQSEYISFWLIDGDGVDFPGLSHFFSYGEKVPLKFTFILTDTSHAFFNIFTSSLLLLFCS